MRNFTIRSLLFAVALIALWMSTFNLGLYGLDIRSVISYFVLLASFAHAVYCYGRRRAYWIGFLFALILLGFRISGNSPFPQYTVQLAWIEPFMNAYGYSDDASINTPNYVMHFVLDSISIAITLLLAPLSGYFAMTIYDRNRKLEGVGSSANQSAK